MFLKTRNAFKYIMTLIKLEKIREGNFGVNMEGC